MALFMLETEIASSGAEQINSLANQVLNLSSTVSSYDISCEDGFDFSTARGVLAKNLEACSIKMQNTSKIIDSVVSNHTELQNSLKFDSPAETDKSDDGTTATTDDGSEDLGTYNDTGYNPGYYGGGFDSGGVAAPAVAIPTVNGLADNSGDVSLDESTEFDGEEGEEEVVRESYGDSVVTTLLTSSGYAYLEPTLIDEDTKEFIADSKFLYDDDGYARYGDYYVISCDSSVGKVGDVIQFKQKDGTIVDCVVGVNTTSEQFKNSVNFIVKKDATQFKALDFTKTLISNNESITNVTRAEKSNNKNNNNEDITTITPTDIEEVTKPGVTIALDTEVSDDETVSI
jgi:signal peptidase I